MREFIIEFYDNATGCICAMAAAHETQLNQVTRALNISSFELHHVYNLSIEDIGKINQLLGCRIEWVESGRVTIRCKTDLDDLPYRLHTGRELVMMLDGKKPLSSFIGQAVSGSDIQDIPEKYFDPYVNSGNFIKHETLVNFVPPGGNGLKRVLYALPAEAWRINAYLLVLRVLEVSGWCEGLERMEGLLLGYTEEENNAYIAMLRKRNTKKALNNPARNLHA